VQLLKTDIRTYARTHARTRTHTQHQYIRIYTQHCTHEISVNVQQRVMGWTAEKYAQGKDISFLSTPSSPGVGPTQPPIQWATGALSPGVHWQGHEANHSLPSSNDIMVEIRHTPEDMR
jgi:hypothetical protein